LHINIGLQIQQTTFNFILFYREGLGPLFHAFLN